MGEGDLGRQREHEWKREEGRERERALVELLSAQLFFAAALLILWNKAAFPFAIFICALFFFLVFVVV